VTANEEQGGAWQDAILALVWAAHNWGNESIFRAAFGESEVAAWHATYREQQEVRLRRGTLTWYAGLDSDRRASFVSALQDRYSGTVEAWR
jgi:hypothetical protein